MRAAIARVNKIMADLRVRQHPDKTFIGRIERGFDFLGYAFTPTGITVALKTIKKCVERKNQLYEQGADTIRVGKYVRRWMIWVRSGLSAHLDVIFSEAILLVS